MKNVYQQIWLWLVYLASILFIMMILLTTSASDFITPLFNLFFVPILLAAATLNVRSCIIISLLATIASSIIAYGPNIPRIEYLSIILVRGAFYLALGYLAAIIAERMKAASRNWQSLVDITRVINTSLDINETLRSITQKAVELSSADACSIRLLSDNGAELNYVESFGLSESYLQKGQVIVNEQPFARRILAGEEVAITKVHDSTDLIYQAETLSEGITGIMGIPLRTGDKIIGQLNLYRKNRKRNFQKSDRRIARAFAEQAATAIQNARLYASVRKNYLDTVRALTRAVEARDPLTHGHSERVAALATRIGREFRLSSSEMETLEFGALLHDIGKISLDDSILAKKTTRYSPDEQLLLEMHPMVGKSILDAVAFLQPAIPMVLYHHECWDGSGYPEGLQEEDIPLLVQIISVANSFDATMYRILPFPLTTEDTMDEMHKLAGTAFSPAMLAVLDKIYARDGKKMVEAESPSGLF